MAMTIQPTNECFEICADGAFVTALRLGRRFTKPHFWPLVGPGAVTLTRAFPNVATAPNEKQDHPHHRGIHFTHGEVKFAGEAWVDFWAENAREQGRIVNVNLDPQPRVTEHGFEAGLVNHWVAPDGRVMVVERSLWRVQSLGHGETLITAKLSLSPWRWAVTFGDTKEGSFAIRVPTWMDEQHDADGPRAALPRGRIVNSERATGEAACWGRHADWVDYSGQHGGRTVGVAMFDHPSNQPRCRWHVRAYGLFAANAFGSRAFGDTNPVREITLAPGQSLGLTYGLLAHQGDAVEGRVAQRYAAFVAAG